MILGQAAPSAEALAVSRGAAHEIFKIIDRVSPSSLTHHLTYDVLRAHATIVIFWQEHSVRDGPSHLAYLAALET